MNRISFHELYIRIAHLVSRRSSCKRHQVGSVIVKNDSIISFGYNGTPHGWNNCCEDIKNDTIPEVIHAEINAIAKVAKSATSTEGADIYLTLSPCFDCAKALVQSGIKRIFYLEEYRDNRPLQFLADNNLTVCQINEYGKITKSWIYKAKPIVMNEIL